MADYITTYSKIHMTPLEPKAEQISIRDIAHALSLLSRANGHFPEFYSVAQHCIHCCEEAGARGYAPRVCLACLLHDGAEAYMSDVTRPVKKHMDFYRQAEDACLAVIYRKYLGRELDEAEEGLVREMDDTLLDHEFYHYMGERLGEEKSLLLGGQIFETVPFAEAERLYLEKFVYWSEQSGRVENLYF